MTTSSPKPGRRIVEVSQEQTVNAPAKVVWDKICEPCSLTQWHDDVETCERSHDEKGHLARHYVMKQVGEHPVTTMYEVELLRSDEIMTIAYIVDIENLPVENYHAQISVTPISDTQCEARIRSRFIGVDWGIPGLDAQNIVTDFYTKGLSKMGRIMEGKGT
jgi:hypothetical protein